MSITVALFYNNQVRFHELNSGFYIYCNLICFPELTRVCRKIKLKEALVIFFSFSFSPVCFDLVIGTTELLIYDKYFNLTFIVTMSMFGPRFCAYVTPQDFSPCLVFLEFWEQESFLPQSQDYRSKAQMEGDKMGSLH